MPKWYGLQGLIIIIIITMVMMSATMGTTVALHTTRWQMNTHPILPRP
jgi:hypothetical protein